jgi:hypothetical protein
MAGSFLPVARQTWRNEARPGHAFGYGRLSLVCRPPYLRLYNTDLRGIFDPLAKRAGFQGPGLAMAIDISAAKEGDPS